MQKNATKQIGKENKTTCKRDQTGDNMTEERVYRYDDGRRMSFERPLPYSNLKREGETEEKRQATRTFRVHRIERA